MKRQSRRRFIAGCSAVMAMGAASTIEVVAAVAPQLVVSQARWRRLVPLNAMRQDTFAALINTRFIAWNESKGDAVLPLRLTEVTSRPTAAVRRAPAPDDGFEKFSLLFAGIEATQLEQGIHRFFHPAIGLFDIFIVP